MGSGHSNETQWWGLRLSSLNESNIERDAFSKVKVILISHEQKVVIKFNDHSLTQIDIH
jgi:hypothetical protein